MKLLSEGAMFLFASQVGGCLAGLCIVWAGPIVALDAALAVLVATAIGVVVWLPMWALLQCE